MRGTSSFSQSVVSTVCTLTCPCPIDVSKASSGEECQLATVPFGWAENTKMASQNKLGLKVMNLISHKQKHNEKSTSHQALVISEGVYFPSEAVLYLLILFNYTYRGKNEELGVAEDFNERHRTSPIQTVACILGWTFCSVSVKLAPWEITIRLMKSQAARGWMPWLGLLRQADSLLIFWKQMSLQLIWFCTRITLCFEHLALLLMFLC